MGIPNIMYRVVKSLISFIGHWKYSCFWKYSINGMMVSIGLSVEIIAFK